MTAHAREVIARLADAHRRGLRLALLFDYDGTLVPIAQHPRMALLGRETRDVLERLARIPSVVVGVLSGRPLDNLRAGVGIEGLFYAGTNGLEMSFGDQSIRHPDREQGARLAARAIEAVSGVMPGYAGAWVEEKPLGLTVHFRGIARPDRIEALRADVAQAISPFAEKLRVIQAAKAIEIMPDLGWAKGSALRWIVGRQGEDTGTLPLYAGDDANDADALLVATELGGIAIGVGEFAPPAQYFLPDPHALSRCLADLLIDLRTARVVSTRRG